MAVVSLHCKASISRLAVELIFLKLCVDLKKKKLPPEKLLEYITSRSVSTDRPIYIYINLYVYVLLCVELGE